MCSHFKLLLVLYRLTPQPNDHLETLSLVFVKRYKVVINNILPSTKVNSTPRFKKRRRKIQKLIVSSNEN